MEGDSVTLHNSVSAIERDDQILWRFGPENSRIAEIYKQNLPTYDSNEIFKDRLEMNKQTGFLTIKNIRIKHSGLYKVTIIRNGGTSDKRFRVVVHGEYINLTSIMSVTEGDSVTLNSDTDVLRDDHLLWMFGLQGFLIVEMDGKTNDFVLHDVADGRFRDRLQMDRQKGGLTITNIRSEHTGLYKLQIINSKGISYKRFNVTVYARLPSPVILSDNLQVSSSSESRCSLACSAVNVSHVTLSWFKGNSLLSSISVSDLSISLSLPLEVEYQDKNTYSCVLNNPIRNHTTHLDITDLCQMSTDFVNCCGFTEAVIRLVMAAVVGLATVAFLVFDIRSRRAEQDSREQKTMCP
ncbi:CD48 antigen-like [Pseudorasbora parva]|uniref:CD48 antigen-like n=1 Tax=Pseudorasbora parva TaxID=51549 RepID=UPI00351DE1CA